MENANVTWLGYTAQPEIKDPTPEQKMAKAVDDYINNETEEVVVPDDWEPQSLEEALLGE